MRLKQVRVKMFSAASGPLLETAINDWVKASGVERTFLDVQYQFDGGSFTAMIAFAE